MDKLKINSKKLNILQAEKGLDNNKFAKLLGIGIGTLLYIKNGSRSPRVQTIGKIAEALQIPVTDLII